MFSFQLWYQSYGPSQKEWRGFEVEAEFDQLDGEVASLSADGIDDIVHARKAKSNSVMNGTCAIIPLHNESTRAAFFRHTAAFNHLGQIYAK